MRRKDGERRLVAGKETREKKAESVLALDKFGLTKLERNLLKNITAKGITAAKELQVPNLTKKRREYPCFRSEDIFFLLEALERGSMPVSFKPEADYQEGLVIREKNFEALYVTPNPEWYNASSLPEEVFAGNFVNTVSSNISFYGNSGKIQAVIRNVFPHIRQPKVMLEEYGRRYPGYWEYFFSEMFSGEDWVRRFVRQTLADFSGGAFNRKDIDDFFEGVSERAGVFVAFKESIVRDHAYVPNADEAGELALKIPGNELAVDYIFGFETLGNFEDEVLGILGVDN